VENPDKEFLKSQLDICKGMVAKKDLEVKKLKESNDLRAKGISTLESLLQESRDFIIKQDSSKQYDVKTPEMSALPTITGDSNNKIFGLEIKTNHLENQLTILASKFETLQFHVLANKGPTFSSEQPVKEDIEKHDSPKQKTTFLCDVCESQFSKKDELKEHKILEHMPKFKCNKFDYNVNNNDELKEHRQTVHKPNPLTLTFVISRQFILNN
jgi:hypothetical protein